MIAAKQMGAALSRAFAQPKDQSIPSEFLALLAQLDREKRGA